MYAILPLCFGVSGVADGIDDGVGVGPESIDRLIFFCHRSNWDGEKGLIYP